MLWKHKKSNFSEKTATSKNWTQILDPDYEKPGPGPRTRTLKNLDPEKHGINMGLKNMSDFRKLYFTKTIRNVIFCLKVRLKY